MMCKIIGRCLCVCVSIRNNTVRIRYDDRRCMRHIPRCVVDEDHHMRDIELEHGVIFKCIFIEIM